MNPTTATLALYQMAGSSYDNPIVSIALRNFLVQLPLVLLVLLGGAVLCLLRWRRSPWVSLLMLGALFLYFIAAVIAPGQPLLFSWLASETDYSTANILTTILSFLLSAARALAWALAIIAAFGWRGEQVRQPVKAVYQ
jgi:hypothetical protein